MRKRRTVRKAARAIVLLAKAIVVLSERVDRLETAVFGTTFPRGVDPSEEVR